MPWFGRPASKRETQPEATSCPQAVLEAYEELRAWRHDLKHHLGTLQALAQAEQWPELARYLEAWSGQVSASIARLPAHTGNPVLDALLADKLARAQALGIDAQAHVVLPYRTSLDDVEWVTLLGNLLENALQACEQAPLPRSLRLSIGFTGGMLRLSLINSKTPHPVPAKGSGIGLKQVRALVARHAGLLSVQDRSDAFEVNILLPLEV